MMMLFVQIIFSSCFSFSDFVPFEYTEKNGFTYYIDLNDVKPGYTAGIIARGGLAGKVRRPEGATETDSQSLADFFMQQIATTEENKAYMDKVQKEFLQTNNTATQESEIKAQSNEPKTSEDSKTPVVVKKVLDWKGFEDCARKNLAFLREAIALKHKMKTDKTAEAPYFLVKSLLNDVTTEQGFVCGSFVRPDLKIRVVDEVRNVKILTALLNRQGIQRRNLLRTLSAAFSEKSPVTSRFLFSYYFSRQFFTAALSNKFIPTYQAMNTELVTQPKKRNITVESEDKTIVHTQTFRVMDSERLLNEGLDFIKSEKL